MSSLEDHGLEVKKYPITKVRLQFHNGHWYVEYRRKPKYILDRWWWFDDGKYADYPEALVRAQVLAATGGIKEVKHLDTQIFEVNNGE